MTRKAVCGNDILKGSGGADKITGGDDNDTMTGGAGSDIFVFDGDRDGDGSGLDTIADFTDGADKVEFSSTGLAFADLTITTSGGDTLITYATSDGVITLSDFTGTLTAADFIFQDKGVRNKLLPCVTMRLLKTRTLKTRTHKRRPLHGFLCRGCYFAMLFLISFAEQAIAGSPGEFPVGLTLEAGFTTAAERLYRVLARNDIFLSGLLKWAGGKVTQFILSCGRITGKVLCGY